MKKVFGQTVRDIKRGVNKKVLKVPGIEQKVLDATSNETWGPHGTLLADIAQATRNFHDFQKIMSVLWKRMSDTGKNWRHVFKALTVLEYLVAHGSERVIDEITEHANQISALSGFQYIDSNGRDQGSNVRKKSQNLVVLVNDKEMIIEVRQKAVASREKFRTSPASEMNRPGSYGDRYDDDRYEGRYGSRDDDRNGYGREREWGSRDDDRYNRNGDSYGQDGDGNGRNGYKDDDYNGRNRSSDEHQHGSRSRSSDGHRDNAYDDGQYSSRSDARAGDQSQNGGNHEQKLPEQNIGAPPSYEEALNDSHSPIQSERNGETASPSAARASPHVNNSPNQEAAAFHSDASSVKQGIELSNEFDPRGSVVTPVSAPTDIPSSVEMDLFGSFSDSVSSDALAIMPATPATTSFEADAHANFGSGPAYTATPSASSNVANQAYENPFGEAPFQAISSSGSDPQPQPSTSSAHFHPAMNQNAEPPQLGTQTSEVGTNFGFEDSFSAITYPASSAPAVQTPTNPQFLSQDPPSSQHNVDILADILPPSGPQPPVASQAPFSSSSGYLEQPNTDYYGGFPSQSGFVAPVTPNMAPQAQIGAMQGSMAPQPQNLHSLPQYPTGSAAQFNGGNFFQQQGPQSAIPTVSGTAAQFNNGNFLPQQGSQVGPQPSLQFNGGHFPQQHGSQPTLQIVNGTAAQFNGGNSLQQQGSQFRSQSYPQAMSGPAAQHNSHMVSNSHPQPGPKTQTVPSPTVSLATAAQPSKNKFETKSSVWADTLSRGLVDLNISGSKTNPLADIGVDFEAINRKEKRMEKPATTTTTQVTSTVTMGKAMGSGSGMGRAGASVLRSAANPMMGPGMGMAMGGGGYGGMPQPTMGGMGQGVPMQLPYGSAMPGGGYNPMMGPGGYPQQPYGSGYR